MMALVRPDCMAIGMKTEFKVCRSGMPKDTLEAPRVVLRSYFCRIISIVSKVRTTMVESAPIGIASGSMTMSSMIPVEKSLLQREKEQELRKMSQRQTLMKICHKLRTKLTWSLKG